MRLPRGKYMETGGSLAKDLSPLLIERAHMVEGTQPLPGEAKRIHMIVRHSPVPRHPNIVDGRLDLREDDVGLAAIQYIAALGQKAQIVVSMAPVDSLHQSGLRAFERTQPGT